MYSYITLKAGLPAPFTMNLKIQIIYTNVTNEQSVIYKRPDVGLSEVYLSTGFNEAVRPREATLHS